MINDILNSLIDIKKKGYKCLRCKHKWIPRKEKKPRWCPKCHSPYWDKQRKKS